MVDHFAHQLFGLGLCPRIAIVVVRHIEQGLARQLQGIVIVRLPRHFASNGAAFGLIHIFAFGIQREVRFGLFRELQRVTEFLEQPDFKLPEDGGNGAHAIVAHGQPGQGAYRTTIFVKQGLMRIFAVRELQQQLVQVKRGQ